MTDIRKDKRAKTFWFVLVGAFLAAGFIWADRASVLVAYAAKQLRGPTSVSMDRTTLHLPPDALLLTEGEKGVVIGFIHGIGEVRPIHVLKRNGGPAIVLRRSVDLGGGTTGVTEVDLPGGARCYEATYSSGGTVLEKALYCPDGGVLFVVDAEHLAVWDRIPELLATPRG